MSDKKLLEFAARAAGVELCQGRNVAGMHPLMDFRSAPFWDPLHNDGDALRLAVKLDMLVYVCGPVVSAEVMGESIEEDASQDPLAATRRAIVRAAAAIGAKL